MFSQRLGLSPPSYFSLFFSLPIFFFCLTFSFSTENEVGGGGEGEEGRGIYYI